MSETERRGWDDLRDRNDQTQTTAQPELSWAEVWAEIGAAADAKLSLTQVRLARSAYRIETTPTEAVEQHDLVPVYADGVDMGDQQAEIHAGYRLIGDPVEVDA